MLLSDSTIDLGFWIIIGNLFPTGFASTSFSHALIGLRWLVSILLQQIDVSGPLLVAL
jgi:hypothetical protein